MKTVYISGKMTGLEERVYKENFRKAELFYRSCGYEVINPCKLSEVVLKNKPDASYEDFMRVDLWALRNCTHIALLENWESSPGARREKAEAESNGLEIIFYKAIGGKE